MGNFLEGAVTQLLLEAPEWRFELSEKNPHICDGHEVVVQIRAISLNRFDVEQYETGSAIERWPAVLGVEASGTVYKRGDLVEDFQPDDEVIALLSIAEDNRSAAFQSHAAVDASMVCKKPSNISSTDAATLPLSFVRANEIVRKALELLPVQTSDDTSRRFFIFGCNSAVGSSVIQILRWKYKEAWIGGTIYGEDKYILSQESIHMIEIGATYVIDGLDPETAGHLKEAAKDPPELAISFPHPPQRDTELLESLKNPKLFSAREAEEDFSALTRDADAVGVLRKMLAEGKYQVTFPANVVATGLESIAELLAHVPPEPEKEKHVVRL